MSLADIFPGKARDMFLVLKLPRGLKLGSYDCLIAALKRRTTQKRVSASQGLKLDVF